MSFANSHDIIVVGASTGGVQALQDLVAELPADLPAAVFVVLHIPSWAPSELPRVLATKSALPVAHPGNNEPIELGRIYVAPPDHHMLLEETRVTLWRGPKENLQRPSVNTLFRSAAVAHGERVVGVVLTGALDDGTTGLWWIKRYGGLAVVQDPQEAMVPDMPSNAMEHVDVDYVASLHGMGTLLQDLAGGKGDGKQRAAFRMELEKELPAWKRNGV